MAHFAPLRASLARKTQKVETTMWCSEDAVTSCIQGISYTSADVYAIKLMGRPFYDCKSLSV